MPNMDAHELAWLVRNAGMPNVNQSGWNSDAWWVATILAESSGDPMAKNGSHFGLTQMSAQHAGAHPAGSPRMPEYEQFMYAPTNNLKGAASLFRVQGVGAWRASAAGRALNKNKANQGVALPKQPSLADVVPGVTGTDPLEEAFGVIDDVPKAIMSAVEVVVDAGKWLTDVHNITRVLYVAGGIALGLVALSIVAKPVVTDVVKTVKPL